MCFTQSPAQFQTIGHIWLADMRDLDGAENCIMCCLECKSDIIPVSGAISVQCLLENCWSRWLVAEAPGS